METAGADAMKTTTKACISFWTATIQNFIQEEGKSFQFFPAFEPSNRNDRIQKAENFYLFHATTTESICQKLVTEVSIYSVSCKKYGY